MKSSGYWVCHEDDVRIRLVNEDKIFRDIEGLRNPQRLARLETERVVSLCLRGPKMERVLDVGTGSGVFAEGFARLDLAVTGIDVQGPMLEAAQRFVPKAHFQIASSEVLPFDDDSFDLVFLGLVLHETHDPGRTLQEAHRVCALRTAVLEWPHAKQNIGPPLEHRLRAEDVLRLAEASAFSRMRTIPLNELILFLLDK